MPPRMTGTHQPLPAAFGSYSLWAGKSEQYKHAYPSQPLPTQGTAAFKDSMVKGVQASCEQGDPGAYDAHARSALAVTAAFSHSRKSTSAKPALVDQRVAPELPSWLFSFNRFTLRDDAVPTGNAEMQTPQTPNGDNEPATADLQLAFSGTAVEAGDAAPASDESAAQASTIRPASAAGDAPPRTDQSSRALYFSINRNELRAAGGEVAARKRERERREAEEKQRRWEAKHWRGKHQPPQVAAAARKKRHPMCKHNYYAILKVGSRPRHPSHGQLLPHPTHQPRLALYTLPATPCPSHLASHALPVSPSHA